MVEESSPESEPTTAGSLTIQLKDPVVGAYVFFEKHQPADVNDDPRRSLIDLLIRARDKLFLDLGGKSRYPTPAEIDLFEVDRSEPLTEPLMNLFHDHTESSHQALAFTFLDTMAAQVFASRIGVFPLDEIQTDVLCFLNDIIEPSTLATGLKAGQWGGRLFLWAMVPRDTDFQMAVSSTLSVFDGEPEMVTRVEHGVFASIRVGGTEGLLLLTQDTPEAEGWAQKIIIEHTHAAPPPLLLLELARSKFDYEHRQYKETKLTLDMLSREIDQRLDWLIDAQRTSERRVAVVGSRESIELLEKLSRATTDYADFRRSVTWVSQLRNTLRINFDNYRLILKEIVGQGSSDQLFQSRSYQMEQIQAQLNHDAVYSDAVLERGQTILETAAMRIDLLRGSQEREEIAFQGIQTGALTAITVGLAMLQIFNTLRDELGLTAPVIWITSVTLMVGTFALSQVVINWKRVKTPVDRISVAVTIGLICSLIVTFAFERFGAMADLHFGSRGAISGMGLSVVAVVLMFFAGSFVGYRLLVFYEARQRRRSQAV